MFLSINKLPNNIRQGDKPDPKAAQALQEGLGGQFGEMRTMMQYLFQNMNFRGDATPYKDLLRSIATEEMGHVELVANTINVLLEGSSTPSENPEELPLSVALESPNIHHFLVAGQSSRPVDAAGNPWSATYVGKPALKMEVMGNKDNNNKKINVNFLEPEVFNIDTAKDEVEEKMGFFDKLKNAFDISKMVLDNDEKVLSFSKKFAQSLTDNNVTLSFSRKGKEAITIGKEANPTLSRLLTKSDDVQIKSPKEAARLTDDILTEE